MAEPTYVQRLVARKDLYAEVIQPMTTPQATYDYMPSTFDGESPVVCMQSGGSDDVVDLTYKQADEKVQETAYEFRVSLLTLYGDNSQPRQYFEDEATDALDRLSDELMDRVRRKKKVKNKWQKLEWQGLSIAFDRVLIDGTLYLREVVVLKMTLY